VVRYTHHRSGYRALNRTSIREALRAFLPPIKSDDARLDFYTVYKRESMEYDVDYVKKYDEDLNTTLIFVRRSLFAVVAHLTHPRIQAGLFSAVSSAFVLDVQSKLETDPNEQSAALLRAILLTLNQSAIPGESPNAPPFREDPPHEIVTATGLMYASLLISLLAAFVAMLGKQWLNRYLRHAGGSMIERCGDRQRKCDGLERWPFHLFVESLPIMLQMSLLLLACGLCRYTWSINTTVASILITLTVLGILFYFGIVIAGTSSYECPFQTPASTRLRSLWREIQSHKALPTCLSAATSPLWRNATRPIVVATHRLNHTITGIILGFNQWVFRPRPRANHLSPVISLREIQEDSHTSPLFIPPSPQSIPPSPQSIPPSPYIHPSSHRINTPTFDAKSLHHESSSSQEIIPNTMGNVRSWLTPEDFTTIQKANAKDARCVSWILRNITDPEALDAAIRLAGMVQWFEDGINVEPPYSIIVSVFHTCSDSTRLVYPGLSERAYYSARAMLWIHTLASCVSEEFASTFPLPPVPEEMPGHPDLSLLLKLFGNDYLPRWFYLMNSVISSNTHVHMQWTLYVVLHKFWANKMEANTFYALCCHRIQSIPWNTIPLDVTLNLLLVCSISLGLPLEDGALKIQDKSYAVPDFCLTPLAHTTIFSVCLAQVISQLSRAIIAAIPTSPPLLQSILAELTKWDSRPEDLRVAAHEWCAVVSKNYRKLDDGEDLIFHCLEISVRGLDPEYQWPNRQLYTKHYPHMADIVSHSGGDETIADLLQAWIILCESGISSELLKLWAAHLMRLGHVASTPQRLRQLAIQSIMYLSFRLGPDLFEPAGVEGFVMLLDRLVININDIPDVYNQRRLLERILQVVQSPEGQRSLSYQYWELIPELVPGSALYGSSHDEWLCTLPPFENLSPGSINYEAQVMVSLEGEQEWDKLECWMGFVWFTLHPETDPIPEDLERVMLSLLRQRPSAAEKLEQRLQRAALRDTPERLEYLRRVCERADLEEASRQDAS